MPGHLFECNPVDEVTTRRGTDTPVLLRENPQVSNTARHVACHHINNSRGKWSSIPHHKTRPGCPVPTLQGPSDWSQKWRGTLRFLPQLEMRPSSIAPNPVEPREAPPNSTGFLTSHRHPENPPRSPVQVEGTQGFLLQPEKDLESPSSTRLETRFPYHDSREMPRSPSSQEGNADLTSLAPHERLPEFPVVPREKPHTGTAAQEKRRDFPIIER